MKIAFVSLFTPYAPSDSAAFAVKLATELRRRGHAVESIRLPLKPTHAERLAARLIRLDTGDPDLVVVAEDVDHAGDWDDTIRRILEARAPGELFHHECPSITDAESLALADAVSSILGELGSTEVDDLAETMARHIAELGHFPNASV